MTKVLSDGYSRLLAEHDADVVEDSPDEPNQIVEDHPTPPLPEVSEDETSAEAEVASDEGDPAAGTPSEPARTAVHDGAGWYTLSDSDEKIRGKEAVLEAGYTINDED